MHSEVHNTGFNKIFVLGAGAIGSIYGALLSKRNNVTLIGNESHVDVLNSKGLSVSGDMNETFHLKAAIQIYEIPEDTLVVLTTKAYDSARAVEKIRILLRNDTTILVLQNGLGNEEIVERAAGGKTNVLRAFTAMAAELLHPGSIKFWNGETVIERSEIAEKVAETFNESALETRLSDDFQKELWNKLVVNCVVNPLTALFQVRNHEILTRSLKTVRHGIVKECIDVGKAEGIAFADGFESEVDERISSYKNFSSMCQDIIRGKTTEIDFLNGKVVQLGKKYNLPVLLNETLECLIKFMEEKNEVSEQD